VKSNEIGNCHLRAEMARFQVIKQGYQSGDKEYERNQMIKENMKEEQPDKINGATGDDS